MIDIEGKTVFELEHEAAKKRIAKLQEEYNGLIKKIDDTYGSLESLRDACKNEPKKTTGEANILLRKYHKASGDLSTANKDLEKAKNKVEKEVLERKIANRPCPRCSRLPDGPMCKACGPANDYVQFAEKSGAEENKERKAEIPAPRNLIEESKARMDRDFPLKPGDPGFKGMTEADIARKAADKIKAPADSSKPWWEGGSLDTVNGMPWHVAVATCLPGQRMVFLPGKYEWNGLEVELDEQLEVLIDGAAPWAPGEVITFMQRRQEVVEKPKAEFDNHPTYEELLAQYKDLCREIEGLGLSYGNPSAEEKKLKKKRLELRKVLRSMAPLKTCWFCSGFSINNYDSPCRDGTLERGDVPRDACELYNLWTGSGSVDEKCLVAWPELQAMQAAGKPRPADPARSPMAKVDGDQIWVHRCMRTKARGALPFNVALRIWGCDDCDEKECEGPEEIPEEDLTSAERKIVVEPYVKRSVVQVMDENAQKAEASRTTSIVISGQGVSIDGGAPAPKDVVSAAIDVIKGRKPVVQQDLHGNALELPAGVTEEKVVSRKRVYEDGFYKISISEEDLLEFNAKWIENKRKIVGAKLRVNPTEDDDFDPEDLPEEIERMIKALNIASLNLQSELMSRGRC